MKSNGSPRPVGAPHIGSKRHPESEVSPGAPCMPVYVCSSQSSSLQSTYRHTVNPHRSPNQQWTARLKESVRLSSITKVTSK